MSREIAVMVIVLTYNRWKDTRQCLESVNHYALKGLQVVVVDNGSSDETVTALRAEFPQVQLDGSFYMYGEDVDWCVRARHAGYQVLFVPRARVWHKGVTRNYVPTPSITYYSARNELHLIRKHHAGTRALLRAWTRHVHTLASWSIRPRGQAQRAHRAALARALRDSMRGATGPVPLA